jgi:hypothetical protein
MKQLENALELHMWTAAFSGIVICMEVQVGLLSKPFTSRIYLVVGRLLLSICYKRIGISIQNIPTWQGQQPQTAPLRVALGLRATLAKSSVLTSRATYSLCQLVPKDLGETLCFASRRTRVLQRKMNENLKPPSEYRKQAID